MANEFRQNTGYDDFKYDPEAEDNAKKYRLPFALCKAKGIEIKDWWTPTDAWAALRNGGYVADVSEEYEKYYRELKKKKQRIYNLRAKKKKEQLKNPEHNPDREYKHKRGLIAGVKKGKPMNFQEADSGNVNPYYGKGFIGYKHNCQTCVAVYIARRLGYNVRALPNLNNIEIVALSRDTTLAYIDQNGMKPQKIGKSSGVKTKNWLNYEVKENTIFGIEFFYGKSSQGHIVVAEKIAGELQLYDPQNNKIYKAEKIDKYFTNKYNISIINLTNVKMNENLCDKIMKPQGDIN